MNSQTLPCAMQTEPRAAMFEGWYDSSLDLKRGLVVTEHGAFDPLAEASAEPVAWRPESLTRWIRSGEGARR